MHTRKLLILLAFTLTFCVMLLGAYTRLTDAGLGCPDWPGCYGLWRAPITGSEIITAEKIYPHTPVDFFKANTEMIHRYFASSLGLLILIIAGTSMRAHIPPIQKKLAFGLVLIVIFQGLLGMWTVTLKLLPIVVIGHLLGGLSLLSIIYCLYMTNVSNTLRPILVSKNTYRFTILALIMVLIQITLGGFTSAHYAALSCPDFPLCQNQWWPAMTLKEFSLSNTIYSLSVEGRTALHMAHRIGALFTSFFVIIVINKLYKAKSYFLSTLLGFVLLTQISLGISNVLAHLPLPIAVAHHCVAMILVIVLIHILFTLQVNRAS